MLLTAAFGAVHRKQCFHGMCHILQQLQLRACNYSLAASGRLYLYFLSHNFLNVDTIVVNKPRTLALFCPAGEEGINFLK